MSMRSLRRSMLPAPTTVAPGVSTTVPRVVAMPCLMSKLPAMQEMREASPSNGVSRPNRLDSNRRAKRVAHLARAGGETRLAVQSRHQVAQRRGRAVHIQVHVDAADRQHVVQAHHAEQRRGLDAVGRQLQASSRAVLARLQRAVAVDGAAFDLRLDVFQRCRAILDRERESDVVRAGAAAHQGADRPGDLALDVPSASRAARARPRTAGRRCWRRWCRRHRRARDP